MIVSSDSTQVPSIGIPSIRRRGIGEGVSVGIEVEVAVGATVFVGTGIGDRVGSGEGEAEAVGVLVDGSIKEVAVDVKVWAAEAVRVISVLQARSSRLNPSTRRSLECFRIND